MSNPSESQALTETESKNFIREMIERDLQTGKHRGRLVTRFPPEPNGFLHIGHSKSICLNFGLAKQYGGRCHLRFDDTNPSTEDIQFVESIQKDVRWLGFDWGEHLYYASDYYEKLYAFAEQLIRQGDAYVCSLSEAEVREYRGSITEPGKPSPYQSRSVEENLSLFARMRRGEFPDGTHVLRAKINMAAPNMKLRDPPIYRIRHAHHYRKGTDWCVYPLYDFAHCVSDALEGITHSLCTLEFENNRDLYDWFLERLQVTPEELGSRPEQTEFARLNLTYTVMSKRKLLKLVQEGLVSGWDDPRMPTIAGLRRRGYSPEAIRAFAERVGISKNNSIVDVALLEHTLRDDLSQRAPRVLCVLRPLKLIIDNYPEGQVEELDAPYFPPDINKPGSRSLPFSRELWIEAEDFASEPPPKWKRLAPGASVRLRYAHVITCTHVEKNAAGEVIAVHAEYHSSTSDAPKAQGTIHWVSAERALDCEVRLYDRLFLHPEPDATEGEDFTAHLNPASLEVLKGCKIESSVKALAGLAEIAEAPESLKLQFERHGFFCLDSVGAKPGTLVFNRTVSLKDSWAKQAGPKAEPAPLLRRQRQKPSSTTEVKPQKLSPQAEMLVELHGLTPHEAKVVSAEPRLGKLLVSGVGLGGDAKAIARWLANDVASWAKEHEGEFLFSAEQLLELIELQTQGKASSRIAKDIFAEMASSGKSPKELVQSSGGGQIEDAASLLPIIRKVLADNPGPLARFREGNRNVVGAFIGQVMRATGGKANPQLLSELLLKELEASDSSGE